MSRERNFNAVRIVIAYENVKIAAEINTEVLIINSAMFGKLTENNIYVRCFAYELLAKRFSSVMWTMQQILFLGFDKRLASYLVKEYDRTLSRQIKTTHEQIAKEFGSAREVVARMLKRFRTEDFV